MEPRKNIPKHKAPSRIKYEKENPVFSARMPKEWHEALYKYRQKIGMSNTMILGLMLEKVILNYEETKKQSYNEGLKIGIDEGKKMGDENAYNKGKQDGYIQGYNQGRDEGYKNGKNEYIIDVPCVRCGKSLILKRDSFEYPTFKRWAMVCLFHRICPQ